jgi:hypothetical protein
MEKHAAQSPAFTSRAAMTLLPLLPLRQEPAARECRCLWRINDTVSPSLKAVSVTVAPVVVAHISLAPVGVSAALL